MFKNDDNNNSSMKNSIKHKSTNTISFPAGRLPRGSESLEASNNSNDFENNTSFQIKDNNLNKSQLLSNSKMTYHNPYDNKSTIYLNMNGKACIYSWYSTVTDEYYIGSTNSGKERFQAYLSPGRIAWAVEHPKDTHGINLRLARSITKYGYNGFL